MSAPLPSDPHPWYGPCDTRDPGGLCSECRYRRDALKTDREQLQAVVDMLPTLEDARIMHTLRRERDQLAAENARLVARVADLVDQTWQLGTRGDEADERVADLEAENARLRAALQQLADDDPMASLPSIRAQQALDGIAKPHVRTFDEADLAGAEELLADLPADAVLERDGLQARMEAARVRLNGAGPRVMRDQPGDACATPNGRTDAHGQEQGELRALRDAARALIAALPRCDYCDRPATRVYGRGGARWCDVHGTRDSPSGSDVPEYPRATPLRALVALLGGDSARSLRG